MDRVDGMIKLTVTALCDYVETVLSNGSLDAKGAELLESLLLTSVYNLIMGPP